MRQVKFYANELVRGVGCKREIHNRTFNREPRILLDLLDKSSSRDFPRIRLRVELPLEKRTTGTATTNCLQNR